MDGRVKTLHPKIHGGLLGRRGIDDAVMAQHGIAPIDLLVVNLYPFAADRGAPGLQLPRGHREHRHRRPGHAARRRQEPRVGAGGGRSGRLPAACLKELDTHHGANDAGDARAPCGQGLRPHRAATTRMVAAFLRLTAARTATLPGDAAAGLREGPGSALRGEPAPACGLLPRPGCPRRERRPAAGSAGQGAVLQQHRRRRHRHRVRAAVRRARLRHRQARQSLRRRRVAAAPREAYERAYRTDPTSAFGGIIAFNRELDAATAARHHRAAVRRGAGGAVRRRGRGAAARAPSPTCACSRSATSARTGERASELRSVDRRAAGADARPRGPAGGRAARCRRAASRRRTELLDLRFAWTVCKFVKSNAIVLARERATIGVGAGQMSRVYSTRIAAMKAADAEA